jgi:hypothetical protein
MNRESSRELRIDFLDFRSITLGVGGTDYRHSIEQTGAATLNVVL